MAGFKPVGSGTSLKAMASKLFNTVKGAAVRLMTGLFSSDMTEARVTFNKSVQDGSFDMLESIDNARKEINTGDKLKQWLTGYVKSGHDYRGVLLQGHLYYFAYPEPLTKEELEYYDPYPLTLCFNVAYKMTGNLVEYGLNLHYLPRKVRKLVVNEIFELFKARYRGQMFTSEPRPFNEFAYKDLEKLVEKYQIDFAVRSYIPSLRKATIRFDYQDWPKALLIETKGFKGITEKQLIQLYYKHVQESKISRT
jgi:hypothetical protein